MMVNVSSTYDGVCLIVDRKRRHEHEPEEQIRKHKSVTHARMLCLMEGKLRLMTTQDALWHSYAQHAEAHPPPPVVATVTTV